MEAYALNRVRSRHAMSRPVRSAAAVLVSVSVLMLTISCSSVGQAADRMPGVSPGPRDPLATENTRALLAWLYSLETRETDRLLSGQEIGPADAEHGYAFWVDGLHERTGSRPAMIALEYFGGTNDPYPLDVERKNRVIVDHWREGGLVSVYHNYANPWTGRRVRDRTIPEGASYSDVYTPGTQANGRFLKDLDHSADQFLLLQEQGVVVIFRPFHEMNRDAFWWHAADPAEFTKLWRYTYRHLTQVRGVHNLLYFFSPGAVNEIDLQSVAPHIYYPGDDFVDIVGLDLYEDNLLDSPRANYAQTVALGKLFGFGEIGGSLPATPKNRDWNLTQLPEAVRNGYPEAVFWVSWSSWYPDGIMSMVELPGARELFADPLVADLSDVDFDAPFVPVESETVDEPTDSGALRVGSVILHSGHLSGIPGPWESGVKALGRDLPYAYSVHPVRLVAAVHFAHALDRLINVNNCRFILVDDLRGVEDTLVDYARRNPEVDFIVADPSLRETPENVYTFGTNIEGWYYLIGIIAGSVTQSDMIGYVAPSGNPWDVEHANEFALGVREVNASARILHVVEPDTATAVRALADEGCDVFNDVVRDPAVILELARLREQRTPVTAFSTVVSHEGAPEFVAAGAPVDTALVFRKMIESVLAAQEGRNYPQRPEWFGVRSGAIGMGGGAPAVDPRVVDIMRSRTVSVPGFGRMSRYDFLVMRHRQLADGGFVLPERSTVRLSPEITPYK